MQKLRKITRENLKILGWTVSEKVTEESIGYDIPIELIEESLDDTTVEDVKEMIRDNIISGIKMHVCILLFTVLCICFGVFIGKIFFY